MPGMGNVIAIETPGEKALKERTPWVHYDPSGVRVTREGAECLSGALGETTGGQVGARSRQACAG